MNGGFPPLFFKNENKKVKNNKERGFAPTIKNNINIHQILQINNNKDIFKKKNEDELNVISSL